MALGTMELAQDEGGDDRKKSVMVERLHEMTDGEFRSGPIVDQAISSLALRGSGLELIDVGANHQGFGRGLTKVVNAAAYSGNLTFRHAQPPMGQEQIFVVRDESEQGV